MTQEDTIIQESTTYPTHFKIISEGRSQMYKIGPRKGPSGRVIQEVPNSLKDQLFFSEHSVNASIAFSMGKEYKPSSGQLIMADEAVPQLATYTPDGEVRKYKTVDFDFYVANQRQGVELSIEGFIEAINYLFVYLTEDCKRDDVFYVYYYDTDNRLVRMTEPFKIASVKKGKK